MFPFFCVFLRVRSLFLFVIMRRHGILPRPAIDKAVLAWILALCIYSPKVDALLLGDTSFEVQVTIPSISILTVSNNLVVTVGSNAVDSSSDSFSSEAQIYSFSNSLGGYYVTITAPTNYIDNNQFILREQTGEMSGTLYFILQTDRNPDGSDAGGWIDYVYGTNIIEVSGLLDIEQARAIRAKILSSEVKKVSEGQYLAELTAQYYTNT